MSVIYYINGEEKRKRNSTLEELESKYLLQDYATYEECPMPPCPH
jgi:hypothetical protein